MFSFCDPQLCNNSGELFCIDCETVRIQGWAGDNKLSTRYTACIGRSGRHYIQEAFKILKQL